MITWGERPGAMRSSSNPQSITVGYCLAGTTGRTIAEAMAYGYSPAIYSGLFRSNIELRHVGKDIWDVDVTYGPEDKKEPEEGEYKWSFTTGGGSKHITQAKSHIGQYVKSGGTAVDHKGTIGLTENGDVDGVDVPDVAFEWTEEWTLALAGFSFAYSSIVGALTCTVNGSSFRGKPAGTVLFKGADGTQSSKNPLLLTITYRFAYSPAATNLTVGDITGIAKAGWDYMWVEYKNEAAPAGGATLPKRPSQVNIERVFDVGDFSLLGIGT